MLPTASTGYFADHHVRAEFVVPADGRLALPTSGASLLVHGLELAPPPLAEEFANAQRWFVYAPGARVTLRARFRAFGPQAQNSAQALPGALHVRSITP